MNSIASAALFAIRTLIRQRGAFTEAARELLEENLRTLESELQAAHGRRHCRTRRAGKP
jgi:hypothetical protein